MSEQNSLEAPSQIQPTGVSRDSQISAWNRDICSVIIFCGIIMTGSFFVPWINVLIGRPSGYHLVQLPFQEAKFLWFIPDAAVIALIAALGRREVAATSQFAGFVPLFALGYYYLKFGLNLFKTLEWGAHLTLLTAVLLLVLPRLLKK